MQDEKGITHLSLRFTFLSPELHSAAPLLQASLGGGGGGRRGASMQQKQSKMRLSVQKKRLEIAKDLGLSTYTVIDRE